jgi:recombination protein RecT
VIKSASYGLLPGRDCHFLPFSQKGASQKQATYVPNYFGVLLSLDRTGKVEDAFAHPVYEGDTFVCDHLAGIYAHVPAITCDPPRQQGKVRFYYACILLRDVKKPHVEIMSLDDINAVRRRAPAHDNGPWVTDFDEMAKKTVLKRASKMIKGAPKLHQMLQEDDKRLSQDIPEARHQDNMAALYSMEPWTPTDHATPIVVDSKTGQILDDGNPLFDLDASAALDRELATQEG